METIKLGSLTLMYKVKKGDASAFVKMTERAKKAIRDHFLGKQEEELRGLLASAYGIVSIPEERSLSMKTFKDMMDRARVASRGTTGFCTPDRGSTFTSGGYSTGYTIQSTPNGYSQVGYSEAGHSYSPYLYPQIPQLEELDSDSIPVEGDSVFSPRPEWIPAETPAEQLTE